MSDAWDKQSPSIHLREPDEVDEVDVEAPPASTDLVPIPPEAEPDDTELRRGDVDAWGRSERARELARTIYD
ncbi:MAG: hypothetical protein ACRDZ1_02585, partial [Acidimicrobiia bacterium]